MIKDKEKKGLLSFILVIVSGVVWRIGGKGGFSNAKLFRRLGTPLCCIGIIAMYMKGQGWQYAVAYALITWGAVSYMGWINKQLASKCSSCSLGNPKVYKKPHRDCLFFEPVSYSQPKCVIDSEFWWQFVFEGFVMQSSMLVFGINARRIAVTGFFSILGGLVKVCIDQSEMERRDVYSELWFGGIMALGIWVSCLISN